MLIFKQFVSSEIPASWESDPVKFRKALSLIKHVRETYIIPARVTAGSEALPERPKNTPAPIDTTLRKQAVLCWFCELPDFRHGDKPITEVGEDGFVKVICTRVRSEFTLNGGVSFTSYRGNKSEDFETRTRLPYSHNPTHFGSVVADVSNGFMYPFHNGDKFGDYTYRDTSAKADYTDGFIAQNLNTGEFHLLPVPELVQDFDDDSDWLTERDANEAAMYVSETDELVKLENWRDVTYDYTPDRQTFICTPTRDQMLSERMGSATEVVLTQETKRWEDKGGTKYSKRTYALTPSYDVAKDRSRTVFVEGDSGFHSIELLNLEVTERYAKRLLNVYRDKQDRLAVGGVRLSGNITGKDGKTQWVHAYCVNNKCNGHQWLQMEASREEQERFVYNVIAHGNNHAAKWFTERETFYVMSTQLSEPILTDAEQYAFLKEHDYYCTDSKCKHLVRMAQLRPDLHRNLALKLGFIEAVLKYREEVAA